VASNDEVRAANGPLTVNSPVDAEHEPELMLMLCAPALNPLTVNGLLLYATAAPPSNEYVPVDEVPVPDNVTVTLPSDPPKHNTSVTLAEACTAHPLIDKLLLHAP
jgi:hypothetical protein